MVILNGYIEYVKCDFTLNKGLLIIWEQLHPWSSYQYHNRTTQQQREVQCWRRLEKPLNKTFCGRGFETSFYRSDTCADSSIKYFIFLRSDTCLFTLWKLVTDFPEKSHRSDHWSLTCLLALFWQVNTFVLFRVVMVTVSSARRRAKMLTPNSSLENQIGIQIWWADHSTGWSEPKMMEMLNWGSSSQGMWWQGASQGSLDKKGFSPLEYLSITQRQFLSWTLCHWGHLTSALLSSLLSDMRTSWKTVNTRKWGNNLECFQEPKNMKCLISWNVMEIWAKKGVLST